MNTMADGAAQRLVAQIGEALFGQSGLTLMELAEKVKGMRAPFLIEEEPLPADMRLGSADYLDYLDAQPSPAGQGDALAEAARWHREMNLTGFGKGAEWRAEKMLNCPHGRFATALEAALAARQPVGQEPDVYLVQAVKDGEAWEHRWYVPRWGDPVPTALDGDVYEIRGRKHPELGAYRVKPFYAAPRNPEPVYQCPDCRNYEHRFYSPPAQAVDLGQFRELAERLLQEGEDSWDAHINADYRYCARELLALIDGKAVGNG